MKQMGIGLAIMQLALLMQCISDILTIDYISLIVGIIGFIIACTSKIRNT